MSGQGPEDPELVVAAGWVNVVEERAGRFTAQLLDGRHRLIADEPLASGGSDLGPGPYELLLMALGACKTMTVRLYAEREHWPLERVSVRLRHTRIHAQDCAECETKEGMLDRIECVVVLDGALDADQRARLFDISGKCPVHRTLTSEISIQSRLQG
jgi:uncharacterized OsmC-like protein